MVVMLVVLSWLGRHDSTALVREGVIIIWGISPVDIRSANFLSWVFSASLFQIANCYYAVVCRNLLAVEGVNFKI